MFEQAKENSKLQYGLEKAAKKVEQDAIIAMKTSGNQKANYYQLEEGSKTHQSCQNRRCNMRLMKED